MVLIGGCGKAAAPGHAAQGLTPRQALELAAQQSSRVRSMAASVRIQVSGSAGAVTTATEQAELRPALLVSEHATFSAAGQTLAMDAIISRKDLYLKLSQLSQVTGKQWVELPVSGVPGTGNLLGQVVQNLQSGDPFDQTRILSMASNVHAAGTQVIDGVQTTRYQGTFSPAAVAASLPADMRAFGQALRRLSGKVAFTIWLDAQHLTRKMTITEHLAGETAVSTTTVTAVNQPVHITLPPPGEVATPGSAKGLAGL